MARSRLEQSRLSASEAVCRLFVRHGSVHFTVVELAHESGLTERTFYRYFPSKQDIVRPVLDWGVGVLAAAIVTRTDLSLHEALVQGFDDATGGPLAERTRGLFPLLFRDAGLRAVLLQALHDGEAAIRPPLAERLGVGADSTRARVAAATTYAMIRVALEAMIRDGRDPSEALGEALREVAADALVDRTAPDRLAG